MFCPVCGHDAGDAGRCPQCGADLSGVKEVVAPSRGVSPAVIWGAFGVVAIVVVIVVVMASGGFGGASGAGGASRKSSSPVPVVKADTSGNYSDLVQRANALYDKGDAAFQAEDYEQGSAYFRAAAKLYAAAWRKSKTDADVGTDYATALFYSGRFTAAIRQADVVIARFPGFQVAYFNKGNYLEHRARLLEESGEDGAAAKDYAAARAAYTKAVSLDPQSAVGKEAGQRLKELPSS